MKFESFEMKYRYTTSDLHNAVIRAYTTISHPPKRGGTITVAMKSYKAYIILHFLYGIHSKENLDITPTLAHRLIKGLFGRSVSNRTLIDVYGSDTRFGSKSADFERVDEIVKRYKAEARKTTRTMDEAARTTVKAAQEVARNLIEEDPDSENESE